MKQLFGRTFDVLETAMKVRERRNTVLSSNISNLETPGYRAKDMPFREVMARYMDAGSQGAAIRTDSGIHFKDPARVVPATTSPGHMAFGSADLTPAGAESRERGTPNNVDIDREMAELALNNLEFQSTVQSLMKEFEKLRTAITEGGKT